MVLHFELHSFENYSLTTTSTEDVLSILTVMMMMVFMMHVVSVRVVMMMIHCGKDSFVDYAFEFVKIRYSVISISSSSYHSCQSL